MGEIMDFSDLAQPLDFKYNDTVYSIPAFTKEGMEKLMAINRQVMKKKKDEDVADSERLPEDSEEDSSGEFFSTQDEMLMIAVRYKDNGAPISQSILDSWPIKVKNAVMKLINQQMSNTVDEVASAEKKS